jgi:hypothetical protein
MTGSKDDSRWGGGLGELHHDSGMSWESSIIMMRLVCVIDGMVVTSEE